VFDLTPLKVLVLGVIALVVFGPERLPAMAAQAGRMLRELRRMAEGAKSELQDSLGPEFSQFDIADLNPKHFVRKHLMDEVNGDGSLGQPGQNGHGVTRPAHSAPTPSLSPGESPPYDIEAT
jgi:sec-independent protein translocase protein TatB